MRSAPAVAGLVFLSALGACSSSGNNTGAGGTGPGAGGNAGRRQRQQRSRRRERGHRCRSEDWAVHLRRAVPPVRGRPAAPAPSVAASRQAAGRRHVRHLRPHPLRHRASPLRELRERPRRHPLEDDQGGRRDDRRRRRARRARDEGAARQDDRRRWLELRLHQGDEDLPGDEQRALRAHVRLVRGRADDRRPLLAGRGGGHRHGGGHPLRRPVQGVRRRHGRRRLRRLDGQRQDQAGPDPDLDLRRVPVRRPDPHLPRLVGRHGAPDADQRAQQAHQLHDADVQLRCGSAGGCTTSPSRRRSGSTRSPSTTSRSAARSSRPCDRLRA